MTAAVSSLELRERIRTKVLLALHRHRFTRTLDVAALCFPERPFGAALIAAQRAMRSMARDKLIQRFVTPEGRHTLYALTDAGAAWLESRGHDATASVRTVAALENPQHAAWANFIVATAEARGLVALTDGEVMRKLEGLPLLTVRATIGARQDWNLRPDAIVQEPDGITWVEVDKSRRGPERRAKLIAIFKSLGNPLRRGRLARVVVFAKTDRTFANALSAARSVGTRVDVKPPTVSRAALGSYFYIETHLPGKPDAWTFEVFGDAVQQDGAGKSQTVTVSRGYIVVQALPLELAKFRSDARNTASSEGWFSDNRLPYARPTGMPPWLNCISPLAAPKAVS